MATAKTPTKTAAKPAAPAKAEAKPVAKPVVATKKAAPVKPKFKPGQQVIGTSAAGLETNGRFVQFSDTARGQWLEINVGDKKNPIIKRYRPKAVRAA